MSHQYLQGLLKQYGYGTGIRSAITSLYDEALNGHLTQNFPLRRSVRQGCPLITTLYALALNPFIILIDKYLQGIKFGNEKEKVTSVAYADDVTVILTNHDEFQTLKQIIQKYEKATGAQITWKKTKCIPIGNWNQQHKLDGFDYTHKAIILGIAFGETMENTIDGIWNRVINKIHASITVSHTRDQDLHQRIRACNTYLLSKLWYVAQILSLPERKA
jgi:hypothetical protein